MEAGLCYGSACVREREFPDKCQLTYCLDSLENMSSGLSADATSQTD
jgi:hypothetical protein